MGVGGEVGLADPGHQFPEGGGAGGVGAQHQGVDEEADEVVEGVVGAAGDRGADGDVGARALRGEDGGEGRLQHHEHAGAGVVREPGEPGVQRGVQGERHTGAVVAENRGPGPVQGQFELVGQAGQGLLPVGDLLGRDAPRVLLVAEHPALPQRVVRVLHGQRCPGRCAARPAGGVGGGEVAGQRGHRPAVGGDVVHHQEQYVLLGGGAEQGGAQGDFAGQVESAGGFGGQCRAEPVLVPGRARPRRCRRR